MRSIAGQVPIGVMALPPVIAHLQAGTVARPRHDHGETCGRRAGRADHGRSRRTGDQISDVMQAVFAPGGTPKPIIDLLQTEIARGGRVARCQGQARRTRLRRSLPTRRSILPRASRRKSRNGHQVIDDAKIPKVNDARPRSAMSSQDCAWRHMKLHAHVFSHCACCLAVAAGLGCGRLSRQAGEDHRAVRGRRPDRRDGAADRAETVGKPRSSSSMSRTIPAPAAISA